MSDPEKNDQPIIIKKVIEGGHGHHGGAWKVAYADFVTAMMALFIVLWILGQDDSVKANIQHYFNDPIGFAGGKGPSPIDGAGNKIIAPKIMTEADQKEVERKRLEKMGNELMSNLKMNDFDNLIDQVDIETTDEGLRVEIMETDKDAFFEVGTASLKPFAKKMLLAIGKQMTKVDNKIVIEGHTDSRPFSNGVKGYSNYELSADRANSARRALIAAGLEPNRIDEIRGYADNRLRDPENPLSTVNRRISIIVKYNY